MMTFRQIKKVPPFLRHLLSSSFIQYEALLGKNNRINGVDNTI